MDDKMKVRLRKEFNKSSRYPVPPGLQSAFKIRNDYPRDLDDGNVQYPWLFIDFKENPKGYLELVKDYCLEGMPECDFDVNHNKIRNWYHAPWFHLPGHGREPLHGLTLELLVQPKMLSITQNRIVQPWACGYYNTPAATVFGNIWADPTDPKWEKDVEFPEGSAIFKVLMCDATDEEFPFMKGSPAWQALIAADPNSPKDRIQGTVRLFQLDVVTKDSRAANGWIFGSFVYDGRGIIANEFCQPTCPDPGWNRLLPVGLMWGSDPELTQESYLKGKKPVESWINHAAETLLRELKGNRPSLGWNGRMNGPADNFVSACASCHGTAQKMPMNAHVFDCIVQPKPVLDSKGLYTPLDDEQTMLWFKNNGILGPPPRGSEKPLSADYSLQLMIGYNYYERLVNGKPMPPRSGHQVPVIEESLYVRIIKWLISTIR